MRDWCLGGWAVGTASSLGVGSADLQQSRHGVQGALDSEVWHKRRLRRWRRAADRCVQQDRGAPRGEGGAPLSAGETTPAAPNRFFEFNGLETSRAPIQSRWQARTLSRYCSCLRGCRRRPRDLRVPCTGAPGGPGPPPRYSSYRCFSLVAPVLMSWGVAGAGPSAPEARSWMVCSREEARTPPRCCVSLSVWDSQVSPSVGLLSCGELKIMSEYQRWESSQSPQIESSRSSLATTTGTRDARPNARATQQFRPETPPEPAQRQPLVTPTRRSRGPANWPRRGILAAWRPMRWHFETTVGSGRMHDPQLLNKPDQLSRVLEETQKKKI